MKKVLFFALAIYFSLSFMLSASAASKAIENFDGYADNTALQKNATVWEEGASFNVKLSTKAEIGKSMQIIPTGERNGTTYGVIILQVDEKSQDWTGAEGIQFWAKTTGGTAATPEYFGMAFMLDDCDNAERPERWACKDQTTYTLEHKDGKTETQTFMSGGNLVLADGFEGLVKIPFSSMEALGWSVYDDELQLGSIKSLYFGIDAKFYLNKEILIDSIQIYGAGIQDTPRSNPSTSSAPKSSATSSAKGTSNAGRVSSVSGTSSTDVSSVASEGAAISSSDAEEDVSALSSAPASSSAESGGDVAADPEDGGSVLPIIIVGIVLLLAAAGAITYFVVLKRK